MLEDWESSLFISKYYDYIVVEPLMVLRILEGVVKFGGAVNILNNMDVYLQFHPYVRDYFQEKIQGDKKKVE